MALTPEDVVNKRFQPTKFREGYDQDEVDDFLDEVVVELRRLNQERGITIVLVEQNAAAALRIADRVYVLENGRAVMEGTPKELLQREDFFSSYFGIEEAEHAPAKKSAKGGK